MKRTVSILLISILAFSLVLAGCSKAESSSYSPAPAYDSAVGSEREAELSNGSGASDGNVSDPIGQTMPEGRKIIRNARISAETLEFDAFLEAVTQKAVSLGGYVQSNNIRNRSMSARNEMRSADVVFRIPAEKLDEFLSSVDGLGNVTSRVEDTNDVTESYIDVEARLSSLRTEYDTLLDLLSKAENLDEIILLQDRLSSVRYEIESYEARKRSYDSQIAYSTVALNVAEVERETVVTKEGFGQEVSRKFRESLEDVAEGFRDFGVGFIGNLPEILVILFIFVGLPLIIVLSIIKSARKRKRKKAEAAKEAEKKE